MVMTYAFLFVQDKTEICIYGNILICACREEIKSLDMYPDQSVRKVTHRIGAYVL